MPCVFAVNIIAAQERPIGETCKQGPFPPVFAGEGQDGGRIMRLQFSVHSERVGPRPPWPQPTEYKDNTQHIF